MQAILPMHCPSLMARKEWDCKMGPIYTMKIDKNLDPSEITIALSYIRERIESMGSSPNSQQLQVELILHMAVAFSAALEYIIRNMRENNE